MSRVKCRDEEDVLSLRVTLWSAVAERSGDTALAFRGAGNFATMAFSYSTWLETATRGPVPSGQGAAPPQAKAVSPLRSATALQKAPTFRA